MIVVSDATPVNILVRIGEVSVLPGLFGSVIIPPGVLKELTRPETPELVRNWAISPPPWFDLRSPKAVFPSLVVGGEGERQAISLALELMADLLLVDDKKARNAAVRLGLKITGTLGVLELAAARSLLSLKDAMGKLRKTDFKISEGLLEAALARSKEQ